MRSIKTRQKNKLINELEFKNYKKIVPAVNEMSAISVTDLEGKIIFINEKFKKLSGYSKKELIGKTHKLINSNTHSKLFFKNLWSQLKSGNVWVGQLKNISRKGDIYWLQSYISPIKDNKGKIKSYFAIQFEITDQKLVEEALAKENAKNIHLTRLATLGEMAAGIAHEINNPLAIIDGFVGSAQNRLRGGKNLEEEIPRIIDNLSKVKKQVERITKIISGLMAFSSA
jgi:two-component system NtrC family sensor kinase